MSLLLDTHVLLWLLAGEDDRFGPDTLDALREQPVTISAATVWEIAIKRRLGKLRAPSNLVDTVAAAGLQLLSVTAVHAEHVADLPDIHRDPFDRLLVSQARLESLTLLTGDALVRSYQVSALDPAG
ncbi:MAG: type II toxin-antitoxin system VapC family toxin [Solirubrobacteraceae bacterium]